MTRIFLLTFLCLISPFLKAQDNTQAIVVEAKQHAADQLRDYSQFAMEAKQNERNVTAPYLNEAKIPNIQAQSLTTDNQNQRSVNKATQNNSSVIIFVSFSMPEKSIVTYLQDAKKIHANVVIRGLINNSFKDTFIKMASIVQQAGGGGVELNPPLFKKFDVSKVPAIVVLPDDQNKGASKFVSVVESFDVVYGNIPLFDAVKEIRDYGTVSKNKAEELFSILKDSLHE